MLTYRSIGLLGFTALTLPMACTSESGGAYTKAEAREREGVGEEGEDICRIEGWYEDGVCDDFCVYSDPECEECEGDECIECLAFPVCDSHETTHEMASECPADAFCRPVSICGHTIWCSDRAACAAVPTCEASETAHTSEADCPADASCRAETRCGATIWCSSARTVCEGDNPAGCISTGCDVGYHCDTTMGDRPSACGCDETGYWTCTADLSGGVCVPD